MTHSMVRTTPRRTAGQLVAAGVATVAMIFAGWIFTVSGLIMPLWAVAGLLVVWALLVWVGFRLARSGSYLVLAVPVVAAAVWLITAWLGDVLLGWTA